MGHSLRGDFSQRVASLLRTRSQRFVPAWPLLPLDVKNKKPKLSNQHQSSLFGKLSAEIRLFIYSYLLADEDRYLHISRDLGGRKRLAHHRCRDFDSALPTWQHSCFGEWSDVEDQVYRIRETVTEDGILHILLSCRRV